MSISISGLGKEKFAFNISDSELNRRVAQELPSKQEWQVPAALGMGGKVVTGNITALSLHCSENGKVDYRAQIEAQYNTWTLPLWIKGNFEVEYREVSASGPSHAFWLKNPRIDKISRSSQEDLPLQTAVVPEKPADGGSFYSSLLSKATSWVGEINVVDKWLLPIMDQAVNAILGYWAERSPIYQLTGWQARAASHAGLELKVKEASIEVVLGKVKQKLLGWALGAVAATGSLIYLLMHLH